MTGIKIIKLVTTQ